MRTTTTNGYEIAGNDHLAIAISTENPADAHYFGPSVVSPSLTLGAFDAAIAWTSPGL